MRGIDEVSQNYDKCTTFRENKFERIGIKFRDKNNKHKYALAALRSIHINWTSEIRRNPPIIIGPRQRTIFRSVMAEVPFLSRGQVYL